MGLSKVPRGFEPQSVTPWDHMQKDEFREKSSNSGERCVGLTRQNFKVGEKLSIAAAACVFFRVTGRNTNRYTTEELS